MIKKLNSTNFFDQIIALEQNNFDQDALTFNQLMEIIQHQHDALFIYCENEEVLGYVYVNVVCLENLVNVMKLVVKSDNQRQGIGGDLIEYVEKWCKDKGMDIILLEVRVSNTPAIKLYKELGYYELTTRKNFYEFPQEDALVLEKRF